MRKLSSIEIQQLESQSCIAQDWSHVCVSDDFNPAYLHDVQFYGSVSIGSMNKEVELASGFMKHSGIRHATLRDVEIGNDCLIENVRGYISNYKIGNECLISNVDAIETTADASFGEGKIVPVLNEAGDGNVMLFDGLNAQLAALMIRNEQDQAFTDAMHKAITDYIETKRNGVSCGTIDDQVRIVNTGRIIDCHIGSYCIIDGAQYLKECTLMGLPEACVKVGTGAIIIDSVICNGSTITNNAKLEGCFVGEACKIVDGFTAENSLFFANTYMANGESCAAFCGPFSASHHKCSLLIGTEFSFYNAGSNTNFSNHAYKMGPLHWGTLERGSKTASGSYLLLPAQIGAFSVCLGKLMNHPDTRELPFSYLIAYGEEMAIVPGRNIVTVGLYRDIRKWPKRDKRPAGSKNTIINFDWLSPFTIGGILSAKHILEQLRENAGDVENYYYNDCVIKGGSLKKGLHYYDLALRLYMGAVMMSHRLETPKTQIGTGKWSDLSGLLIPQSEEQRIVEAIRSGELNSVTSISQKLLSVHEKYDEYRWTWTYSLICDYYGIEGEVTEADAQRIHEDYVDARHAWIAEIRKDAEKEFALGDVSREVLADFLSQLEGEGICSL